MACPICGNAGKIPFEREDGSIVKNAWVDCPCKPMQDHFQPFNPDGIDFPCSSSWRRYYETEGGRPDPGYIPPEPEPQKPQEQVVVHRHSNLSKLEADLLQQTARKLGYLEKKVAEKQESKRQSKWT